MKACAREKQETVSTTSAEDNDKEDAGGGGTRMACTARLGSSDMGEGGAESRTLGTSSKEEDATCSMLGRRWRRCARLAE